MSEVVVESLGAEQWAAEKPSLIRARGVVDDVTLNGARDSDGDLIEYPATWDTGGDYYATPTRHVSLSYFEKCRALVEAANRNEIEASDVLNVKAEELGSDFALDLRKLSHGVYKAAVEMGITSDAGTASLLMHAVADGLEPAIVETTGRKAETIKTAKAAYDRALMDGFNISPDTLRKARSRRSRKGY